MPQYFKSINVRMTVHTDFKKYHLSELSVLNIFVLRYKTRLVWNDKQNFNSYMYIMCIHSLVVKKSNEQLFINTCTWRLFVYLTILQICKGRCHTIKQFFIETIVLCVPFSIYIVSLYQIVWLSNMIYVDITS